MRNQWVEPIVSSGVESIVVKCKILRFSKPFFIVNKLSFICLIIYSTSHPIIDRLGTVVCTATVAFLCATRFTFFHF